jgi:hypothetical protein
MGGFINSLRPVNLATPLIEEAMSMAGSSTDEPAAEEGVLLRGTIVDAATGKPIAGAVFIVLNEGLTWETAEGTDEEIYEQVVTDRKGYFETTLPLQRGGTYSVGYTARNYEPQIEDGVEITDETADVVDVKLSLQRK